MSTPTSEVELDIQGMTCASCVAHVEKALRSVPGVATCEVNLALERARVTLSSEASQTRQLVEAVSSAGYRVVTEEQQLLVPGLDEAPAR
jgi:copper chaperone CopZ